MMFHALEQLIDLSKISSEKGKATLQFGTSIAHPHAGHSQFFNVSALKCGCGHGFEASKGFVSRMSTQLIWRVFECDITIHCMLLLTV